MWAFVLKIENNASRWRLLPSSSVKQAFRRHLYPYPTILTRQNTALATRGITAGMTGIFLTRHAPHKTVASTTMIFTLKSVTNVRCQIVTSVAHERLAFLCHICHLNETNGASRLIRIQRLKEEGSLRRSTFNLSQNDGLRSFFTTQRHHIAALGGYEG